MIEDERVAWRPGPRPPSPIARNQAMGPREGENSRLHSGQRPVGESSLVQNVYTPPTGGWGARRDE
jgi:hypothetical protein